MEHAGDIIGGFLLACAVILVVSLCVRGWKNRNEPFARDPYAEELGRDGE